MSDFKDLGVYELVSESTTKKIRIMFTLNPKVDILAEGVPNFGKNRYLENHSVDFQYFKLKMFGIKNK